MSGDIQGSVLGRAAKWFDPRWRTLNMLGFILNRVTALGLTLYLFLHLGVLSRLAQGAKAYDSFIALAHSPVFIFGEALVVAAGFIHGLNGIRIALNSFGVGARYQKALLVVVLLVALASSLVFAVRMFSS
jgi:succinate dehydrogenase / fumarate reductase cytochrome b subunit